MSIKISNGMRKIYKFLFLVIILLTVGKVYAEDITPPECTPPQTLVDNICTDPVLPPVTPESVSIHLTITTKSDSLYDQDINVTACDSNNPIDPSNLKITAYCAVLQSGLISDWNTGWELGIFLNSINNINGFTTKDKNNNDVYHYWSWAKAGSNIADTNGLNQYELQPNDLITLTFIDPVEEIIPEVHTSSSGGGSSSNIITLKKFNIDKAFEFLISQQKENGSFGPELYTDWATIALMNSDKYQDAKLKLIKYHTSNKPAGTLLTDYERYAMAIMSLGLNPYSLNSENYIEKITKEFDGTQFGNKAEVNDDIFALLVLQNAGYTKDEEIIQKTISFVLSQQKDNGSWNDSVDMTGAAIESIASLADEDSLLLGVSQADGPRGSAGLASPDSDPTKEEFSSARLNNSLLKAKEFLKQKQKTDGSWENISSTSWALQGLLSLDEKIEDRTFDYLAQNQDTDGEIKNSDLNNRIWQTSYLLSTVTGKTWLDTMQKFEKKITEVAKEKEVMKVAKAPVFKKEIVAKEEVKEIENIAQTQTATALNAFDNIEKNKEIKTESKFKKTLMTILDFIF